MQRLDAAGNRLWGPTGLTIPADTGATPGFATLVAAPGGSVVVAWMRDISFRGLRHLHAQKFDAAGAPQWGTTRLSVFDQASLPSAQQVRTAADGAGGAWLAWHFAPLSTFSTRVQHLTAAGTETFAHDGLTEQAIEAVEAYPQRFRILGNPPLDRPDSPQLIASWKSRPGRRRLSMPA